MHQPKGFALTLSQAWLQANPLTTSAFKQEVTQWKNVGVQLLVGQV
nr:hypothetical protein [Paludibacterium denitrificans]